MHHSVFEDIFALICAGLFVAFGINLFQAQDLMVGGAAGLALLGSHASGWDFGVLFFLMNLPFYALAWTQISKRFTLNTFVTVTTISVMTEQIASLVNISQANPIFTAIFGGLLIGVGMLIMFRHSSSLGGLGILAFYLQGRFNIRAGHFQLVVDSVILTSALVFIDWTLVLISILAAFCLNLVISVNHRPERYQTPPKKQPAEAVESAMLGEHLPNSEPA